MTAARAVLLAALLPLLGGWELFRSADPDVRAGNQAFERGAYAAAAARYRVALEQGEDLPGIYFNLGTALYEQAMAAEPGPERERLLDLAELNLRRGGDAQDPSVRASAYYNLGNALYQRGRYDDAVEAYKKALYANPRHADARHNLELALRARKQQREQQPQQPQQGGGGSGDQPPQPQDGDQPPQPQDGEGEGDQPQPQPQDGEGEGEGDQPQPPSGDGNEDLPSPERPQPADQPPQTTFESATDTDRKLEELERRSRNLRLQRARAAARGWVKRSTKKDW